VITDYKWDFGMGSTPSSAIGEGPHTVVYAMNSNPVASLKVSNILGTDSASMAVTFDSIPTAGFTFTTIATQTIQFTDQSSSNSKSWLWSFGDGNTSTVQNPTHVYQNGGDYDVTLYAINDCGQDSLLVNLYVTGLGVDENRTIDDLLVYPNPVDDVLIIERDARNSGFIQIDLWDAMGRELQTHDWNRGSQIRIDMSRYSPGVYIVKINQGVSKSVRIIKN
jgi:PKD repeat protein